MLGEALICIFILKKIFSGVSISCTVPLLFLPLLTFQALACSGKDNIRIAFFFWSYLMLFYALRCSTFTKPCRKEVWKTGQRWNAPFLWEFRLRFWIRSFGQRTWAEPADWGRLSCPGLEGVLVGAELGCSAAWTQPYCIQVKNGYFCTAILLTASFGTWVVERTCLHWHYCVSPDLGSVWPKLLRDQELPSEYGKSEDPSMYRDTIIQTRRSGSESLKSLFIRVLKMIKLYLLI